MSNLLIVSGNHTGGDYHALCTEEQNATDQTPEQTAEFLQCWMEEVERRHLALPKTLAPGLGLQTILELEYRIVLADAIRPPAHAKRELET